MSNTPMTTNPYPWTAEDYLGRQISISVAYDQTARTITGITVVRDPACLFTKLPIGLGADGTPDSSDKAIAVPSGTTVLTTQQLNLLAQKGLSTIDEFLSFQITAVR